MSVMEKITAEDYKLFDYIREYDNQPLILYGAGIGAKRILYFLQSHQILPKYIVVDRKYFHPNMKIETYEVKPVEDIFEHAVHEPVDVIGAFLGFDIGHLSKYQSKIRKILKLDDEIFYGYMEKGDLPCVPRKFYEIHAERIEAFYHDLQDDFSRKTLISYLNQRISCDMNFSTGMIQENQYFDAAIINFGQQKKFIDCGSYNGSDTKRFFSLTRSDTFSYVFEADEKNMSIVKRNLKSYESRIQYVNKGVWNCNESIFFDSQHNSSSAIAEDGNIKIECISLDQLMETEKYITFIKMDIEGAELRGLDGAKNLISCCHPVLAICVYHRPKDIFQIYEKIKEIDASYRFYLRRYHPFFIETVLYAI
mgnify:CR=1 FL=1